MIEIIGFQVVALRGLRWVEKIRAQMPFNGSFLNKMKGSGGHATKIFQIGRWAMRQDQAFALFRRFIFAVIPGKHTVGILVALCCGHSSRCSFLKQNLRTVVPREAQKTVVVLLRVNLVLRVAVGMVTMGLGKPGRDGNEIVRVCEEEKSELLPYQDECESVFESAFVVVCVSDLVCGNVCVSDVCVL